MNAKKCQSVHYTGMHNCVFLKYQNLPQFSVRNAKRPLVLHEPDTTFWYIHVSNIHKKLPINAHGNLTCGARGLNWGLGLQIARMHAVIHLQFWAYGSLDSLLPISMSLTETLWVLNAIFHDKSAIPLHPGTRWNKNFASQRQTYAQKMQDAQVKNHWCLLINQAWDCPLCV